MTSPTHSPEAFSFRPSQEPVKTRAWACSRCGKWYLVYQMTCPCHTSSLLHGIELSEEQLQSAKSGAVLR